MPSCTLGLKRSLRRVAASIGLVLIAAHGQGQAPRQIQFGQLSVVLDTAGAREKYDACMATARSSLACEPVRAAFLRLDPQSGVESRISAAILALRERTIKGQPLRVEEFDRILLLHGIAVAR